MKIMLPAEDEFNSYGTLEEEKELVKSGIFGTKTIVIALCLSAILWAPFIYMACK